MTDDEFRELAEREGYGEVREVSYQPNQRPDLHSHEFAALVLLTEGGLTLVYEDGREELSPGDLCRVPAGRVHAEHGGPHGGAALLATRP